MIVLVCCGFVSPYDFVWVLDLFVADIWLWFADVIFCVICCYVVD